MNPSREHEAEALRSDIDVTRRRMDETIDALGERMKPRHLLDEVLGYFRRSDTNMNTRLSNMRDKLSHGAETATHAVVDTVKNNPMPLLLIGAGVAWMIYNNRRSSTESMSAEDYDYTAGDTTSYDPDAHIDRPLEYPATTSASGISEAGWSEESSSKLGRMKESIGGAAQSAKEKLSHAGEAAREKLSAARQRASELGSRVRERTGEMYSRTRDRVVTTADERPIEVGLVCLAAGVAVGLALPTPQPINRRLGERADRLRERARESGREFLEKGKRVVSAAMGAAKEEAKSQGLTPEHLREQASATGNRAMEAGREAASGMTGSSLPEGNQSGSQVNDPTVARPAV